MTGLRHRVRLPDFMGIMALLVGPHALVRPVERLPAADRRRGPAAVELDRLVHDAGDRLGERAVLPDRHLRRCWRSGSTSWSARPACSTSATSRSSPSARTRWRCSRPSTAGASGSPARRHHHRGRWPGVILGAPTLRLRGDYLAIVTLGFGEIIRITANNTELHRRPARHLADPAPAVAAGRRGRRGQGPALRRARRQAVLLPAAGRDHRGDHHREAAGAQPGRPVLGGDPGGRGRGRADGRADVQVQARLRSSSAPSIGGLGRGRSSPPRPPRSPRRTSRSSCPR